MASPQYWLSDGGSQIWDWLGSTVSVLSTPRSGVTASAAEPGVQ